MIQTYKILIFLLLSSVTFNVTADEKYNIKNCSVFKSNNYITYDFAFTDSSFWMIEKEGKKPSYILGTIHVKDPIILEIPEIILNKINETELFVAESVLTHDNEARLGQKMFSANQSLLTTFDNKLQIKISRILDLYKIPSNFISILQPWAAYLIINFPPKNGEFLDSKLQKIAGKNNKTIIGLESIEEQISIFTSLNLQEQYDLLFDSICNYELIQNNLDSMISYYKNNDIKNLVALNSKYQNSNHAVYKKLQQKLIYDRNINMASKILDYMAVHSTFIAVGILHLTGTSGILADLEQSGYTVTPVF